MARETSKALPGTNISPSQSQAPAVQVVASQAVVAPADKLARLGDSIGRNLGFLERRVEYETQEAERDARLKLDFEGKLHGVETQTAAMANMEAWKKTPEGIEQAKQWHLDALNQIEDEDLRRAAQGYVMSSYHNTAIQLQSHYQEKEQEHRIQGAEKLLYNQLSNGSLRSKEGINDSLDYLEVLLGDRRTAGKLLTSTLIKYADAEADSGVISPELMSEIKIDDVPLEHVYSDELVTARDGADRRRKQLNSDAVASRDYDITKSLQDQLFAGTLTDKELDRIEQQYPDYSKEKLLSFRSQRLAALEKAKEETDNYAAFTAGDYTASRSKLSVFNDNMKKYVSYLANTANPDGSPRSPAQLEQAIIDKSKEVGSGFLYEPWKQELEHAEPGGGRFPETSSMFQRLYAYDPSYAEGLVSKEKAAQYHAYNHLVAQGVPHEQATEIVRTGATPDGLKEARARMNFREDAPYNKVVSKLGGNNDRYARDVIGTTMATFMASGLPEEKAADLARERFKATHQKFGDSWVYTAGEQFPHGFEDAANGFLKKTLPKLLEDSGLFTDPNGYTIGTVPATLGSVPRKDGKGEDRIVVILDSQFRPVMLGGKPFSIGINELTEAHNRNRTLELQNLRKKTRKQQEMYYRQDK